MTAHLHYIVAVVQLLTLEVTPPPPTAAQRDVVLATTTSVRDAGLLESVLPAFERVHGYRVRVIAVGSGQAMVLGRRGEADVLILHDPEGEQAFVAKGFGVERQPLMSNQFVLLGPMHDPAGVNGLDVLAAFQQLARHDVLFVGRGDRSGTDVREQWLWARAGVQPASAWYRETGQGMSASLQIANQLQAYVLTDIGTYLSHRSRLDLRILSEGDSLLYNPYHVILVNGRRFPWVNVVGARALRDYLVSPEVQRAIGVFGRDATGRALFVPRATSP